MGPFSSVIVSLISFFAAGGSGLSAASASQKALTTFGRWGYLRRVMESGAVGFLLKDAPASK